MVRCGHARRLAEYHGPAIPLPVEIRTGVTFGTTSLYMCKGKRLPQPRTRFPTFTLFVKWRGVLPLVRWRTTVGGWRTELASDGQEYYLVAGVRRRPRALAPHSPSHRSGSLARASSPLSSFVKEKPGQRHLCADESTTTRRGPGMPSAYGLAAAIHEEMPRGPDGPRFFDNGIRSHGSFDYLSLRGRFSHG